MFNYNSHLVALFLLVSLSTGLKAEDKATVFDKKQPDNELSVLGFTIGKSTLDEVKTKFKSKDFHHEADAITGIKLLCFKANGTTIAFESDEKARTDKVITSISINSSQRPYRLDKACEKTSLIKSKLAINNVSLGMSTDLIKKVKGLPSLSTPELIIYQYETKEGSTSIVSSLNIRFKDNAVSSITATKIENNTVLQ